MRSHAPCPTIADNKKANNEAILQGLVDKCDNGIYGTMAQAVEELSIPRIKAVRPFKSYDGMLTLGDPTKYETALSIHVERFFKTKRAAAPSASTVVNQPNLADSSQAFSGDGDVDMGGTEFSGVKQMRNYWVSDPTAPGGKRDIPIEELEKGYQYGRTVVPFSESDYSVIKIETKKQFSILGFIPWSSVGYFFSGLLPRLTFILPQCDPFYSLGETGVIVAQRQNEEAEIALSALIHALHELESYAVARFVQKDGSSPLLFLLKPNPGVEDPFECLYDVPLPFAEDVRTYQFPPLDKVLTVTGHALNKEHRLLPNEDLNQAMSDYVDAMDISTFGTDDDG